MKRFKREDAGFYYFENKGGQYLAGIQDWSICHIYKLDKGWGWSIDKSMTKGTFRTLKEAREYFSFL